MSELAQENLTLLDLVRSLADDTACLVNAEGVCEAHKWTGFDSRGCPHGRAQRYLAEREARETSFCLRCGRPCATDQDVHYAPEGEIRVCFREKATPGGSEYETCQVVAERGMDFIQASPSAFRGLVLRDEGSQPEVEAAVKEGLLDGALGRTLRGAGIITYLRRFLEGVRPLEEFRSVASSKLALAALFVHDHDQALASREGADNDE